MTSAPKTTSKWSPKRSQIEKGRPSRNIGRHCPNTYFALFWELRFRCFFRVCKKVTKKHRKIEKVPKMTSQRGVPGWTSNVVFAPFGAPGLPWGPSWLPDLAQGPPGPVQTCIFVHLGQFLVDFWWNLGTKKGHNSVLFFTYFCSPSAGRVQ